MNPASGDSCADKLLADGYLATTDAVASVTEYHSPSGGIGPERIYRARIMRGLDLDVIASRGLDIGDASFRGIPLSWFSPIRDARALASTSGDQWLTRFNGGLVTTCGLDNIGPATATSGLHGNFSHQPARDISWRISPGSPAPSIEMTGTVEIARMFGSSFRVMRRIVSWLSVEDCAELRIVDSVTNIGAEPAPMSILYHINFGAPLVLPGTTVSTGGTGWIGRDDNSVAWSPSTLPNATDMVSEAVFEHEGVPRDDQGIAHAVVRNERVGLQASVRWSTATLPKLYQWVFPTRGRWALGIEPANSPLFGPGRVKPHNGAPTLAPGETVEHQLGVTVSELDR